MTGTTCCQCEGGCERDSHGESLCDWCVRDGCRPHDEYDNGRTGEDLANKDEGADGV